MINDYISSQRIPVLDSDGTPLMPTKYKRAKKWIREKKAFLVKNEFNVYCVKLAKPAKSQNVQKIVLGIDPGRCYTGMGVQSKYHTLLGIHIKLPEFEKKRSTRTTKFGAKIRSDIKKNRLFENSVAQKIMEYYPIKEIVYEMDLTKKDPSLWNPTIVGQYWQYEKLDSIIETYPISGVTTSNIRKSIGMIKQKKQKGQCKPETQVVDGIALTHYRFLKRGKRIKPYCRITPAPFLVVSKEKKTGRNKRGCIGVTSNITRNMDYISALLRNNYEK